MASDNRLWGSERIRGELLKLGIHVSKRTIQKYLGEMRAAGLVEQIDHHWWRRTEPGHARLLLL